MQNDKIEIEAIITMFMDAYPSALSVPHHQI